MELLWRGATKGNVTKLQWKCSLYRMCVAWCRFDEPKLRFRRLFAHIRTHIHTQTHTYNTRKAHKLAGYEGSTCQSTKQVYVRPATRRRPRHPPLCTCERFPVASRVVRCLVKESFTTPYAPVCCVCFFFYRFRFLFLPPEHDLHRISHVWGCVCVYVFYELPLSLSSVLV